MPSHMFRTIEISDPQFEFGNLRFITVKTPNLKGRGDICLFLPLFGPETKEIPLIILLHGVYGSSWAWALKAGVHETADRMIRNRDIKPMAIAMPSDGLWGDGSAYLAHHGLDFERWIVDDVPLAAAEVSSKINKNSPLFISGLSMGGFGALRLGIKYHSQFSGISAHSAITDLNQMSLFVDESIEGYKQQDSREESVWDIIQTQEGRVPPLRFDCGTEDLLIEGNRKLHKQLDEEGINHQYQEFPGGHEWWYWQEHVVESLLFFNKLFINS